jgi:tetratricopeptide (TPR) repeat protein
MPLVNPAASTTNDAWRSFRSWTRTHAARSVRLWLGVLLIALPPLAVRAQQAPPTCLSGITVAGTVRAADGQIENGAAVYLSTNPSIPDLETNADAIGRFLFSSIARASFRIHAEHAGRLSQVKDIIAAPGKCSIQIDLTLQATEPPLPPAKSSASVTQAMEFADQPNFTIAGVTDWTAAGGHGSDTTLRTTETLANETRSLRPQVEDGATLAPAPQVGATLESENELRAAVANAPTSFRANHQLGIFYLNAGKYTEAIRLLESAYRAEPANQENQYDLARAYKDAGELPRARKRVGECIATQTSADLCRLAAELDEELGDPLSAVREYDEAAKLNPSEQNYFEWGSELLLHRAVWQAQEVLRKGVEAYPQSVRMQTALGTALFAGARYDQAAQRYCVASDLDPQDPNPYLFMGRIQIAAPDPLACIEPRLARFVQSQPGSAVADYLYAMSILKRQEQRPDEMAIQQANALLLKAVSIDSNCGEAYLELGILAASKQSFEPAIAFYKKAIAADPGLADAHYRLGMAYDRTAQPAEAKQEFQLHDQIKRQQAAEIEKQRRELKQFLIALPRAPDGNSTH